VNWVIAAGFFAWSLATATTALIHGFAVLLVVRLVLGIGESVAFPSCSKILARHCAECRRGLANAVIIGGMMLGPALGTFAGGMLMARFGWRPFKTAEDTYEAVVNTRSKGQVWLAFNESSGPCLTRAEGNDNELQNAAIAQRAGSGRRARIRVHAALPAEIRKVSAASRLKERTVGAASMRCRNDSTSRGKTSR